MRKKEIKIIALAALISLIASQSDPFYFYYEPLFVSSSWAVLIFGFAHGQTYRPLLFKSLLLLLINLLLIMNIPTTEYLTGPLKTISEAVSATASIDVNTHTTQALHYIMAFVPVALTFLSLWLSTKIKLLDHIAYPLLIVLMLVVSLNGLKNKFLVRMIVFDAHKYEYASLTGGLREITETAELKTWLSKHIPKGSPVLADPTDYFRRIIMPYRISIDLDLISLLPYVPEQVPKLFHEYRRDYGIDFYKLKNEGRNIHSAFFSEEGVWERARNKALAGQLPYRYIIESAGHPRAAVVPIYENQRYRVYEVVNQKALNIMGDS